MKRFYEKVSIEPLQEKFTVLLDGKTIKTPAKNLCLLPTQRMAQVVAKEWDDQEEKIIPQSMPITKLINTSIDRVDTRRGQLIDELVGYAGTDQICYRAEQPSELVELQNKIWNPLKEWIDGKLAINLRLSNGIIYVEQEGDDLEKIKIMLEDLDSYRLTALHGLITITGSVTIGYALYCGHLSLDDAWYAGQLDENFQVTKWGADKEAEDRRQNLKAELKNAYYFLQLI